MSVPQNGVFVLESTLEKISNNNPSDAMEYNILGNGNSVPIMLKTKCIYIASKMSILLFAV